MLPLISILFGASFTLAVAYALGSLCLRTLPVPRTIVLGVGAAALSGLVFLLLLAGLANPIAFSMVGVLALAGLLRFRAPLLTDPPQKTLDRTSRYLLAAVLAAYAVIYFIYALAPEIQPDGISYHLGLVAEYLRLGAFPNRVGFYEMVPQGMEMLYLFAFAFGRHSAAKLVHFGFLLATLPLIVAIGRRLRLSDLAAWLAAAIYFCAPVVATSGTCSYNDAALVFFTLSAFYLMLVWYQSEDDRYLLPAGLAAGFCYAVKFPGIVVLPAVFVVVLLPRARQYRRVLLLLSGGLLMFAPWMLRNAIITGNPLAPLFNRWFPNPYFHAFIESRLANTLSSYGGVTFLGAPWQLALGGKLQGIYGPLLLVLPLGLVALRRRAGQLCWLAAMVLALPWFVNLGARFLMPAFPFFALAFAMALGACLPRPALWACLLFEAVACWPQVVDRYAQPYTWRLPEFPLRAALRVQPESDYLFQTTAEYKIADMIQRSAKPGEKIYSLVTSPRAYITNETLEYWHSVRADQLFDTLIAGSVYGDAPLYDVSTVFPPQRLRGVRFRLTRSHPGEWCVHEVRLFLGDDRVYSSPQWELRAKPGPWEVPAAFDDNVVTRWRTWVPMLPGMFVEADFDRPQLLTSVLMITHTPVYQVPFEIDAQGTDGKWFSLSRRPRIVERPHEDLRRWAAQGIRSAGYRYILAPDTKDGNGVLGRDMLARQVDWGLETAGKVGNIYLFRVR